MQNVHKPFHQKYRPNNLDELLGQEFIAITLKQALISQKIAPAYLFNGPRGTGKTSSARIFAKSLNCQSVEHPTINPCGSCELCRQITDGNALDIIEIDAASNTGVENIREIIERSRFTPSQARWKVYVIDECHMLSTAASNALLKTIEEPPARVVFILATTNPERVLTTIQSRCQKFDFRRIQPNSIFQHLCYIAEKESINFENKALKLIAKRSNGGMRDAQRLLDQLSLHPDGITVKNVQNLLGEVSQVELINLVNSLIENDPAALLININKLYDDGNEPNQIIIGLLNITRDILLHSTNNPYSELYYSSVEFHSELNEFANKLDKSKIIEWHKKLRNVEYQIKTSDNPRLWLEIHLTSLVEKPKIKSLDNNPTETNLKAQNLSKNLEKQELLYNDIQKQSSQGGEVEIAAINAKDTFNNIQKDNNVHDLKEKWELILSKLELPSTKMLLSQQAELESINRDVITIALSPNWENMIKSRKVVIENAVKKVFGEQIKLNFSTKKHDMSNTKKNNTKEESQLNMKSYPNSSKNKDEISLDKPFDDGSKNLANFFNGKIIDIEE